MNKGGLGEDSVLNEMGFVRIDYEYKEKEACHALKNTLTSSKNITSHLPALITVLIWGTTLMVSILVLHETRARMPVLGMVLLLAGLFFRTQRKKEKK